MGLSNLSKPIKAQSILSREDITDGISRCFKLGS
jgi:hypothetical protein